MSDNWGKLMRLSRQALNLTQDDFAADLGKSRSMIGQWENGSRPIPSNIRRVILDVLGGYYGKNLDLNKLRLIVDQFEGFSSIHYFGHRGLYGNQSFLKSWNEKIGVDFYNANILNYLPSDALIVQIAENHTLRMLEGKSEFAQIKVYDKSALLDNYVIMREITPINIGVGTVALVRETLSPVDNAIKNNRWATAITKDGTEEHIY